MINWRIGQHDDINVTMGTGLLFKWNGPLHNVIEMSSPSSVLPNCPFVRNQRNGMVRR